jgi:hypothetical protein
MNLIVSNDYDDQKIEYKIPFRADADKVIDADGRTVCEIANNCSAEEAIRTAKLLASSVSSLEMLSKVGSLLHELAKDEENYKHGQEDEDKSNCLICKIDSYINGVLK